MVKLDKLDVYASYDKFVDHLINPENAALFGANYSSEAANQIGFMSYRYLRLSLQYPLQKLKDN